MFEESHLNEIVRVPVQKLVLLRAKQMHTKNKPFVLQKNQVHATFERQILDICNKQEFNYYEQMRLLELCT